MKFYHLSDKPFTKLRNRKLGIGLKPGGIWLAPSGVWKKYIQEELGGEIPKYEYEFDIDMTKVLTLNVYKDVSEFQEKYKDDLWKPNQYTINWDLVKKIMMVFTLKMLTSKKQDRSYGILRLM